MKQQVQGVNPAAPTRQVVGATITFGILLVALLCTFCVRAALTLGATYLIHDSSTSNSGRVPLDYLMQIQQLESRGSKFASLDSLPLPIRALSLSPSIIQVISCIVIALLLLKILSGISTSDPFKKETATLWKWIGVILILWSALQGALDMLAISSITKYTGNSLESDILSISTSAPRFDFWLIGIAIVCFFMARAFVVGKSIKDDLNDFI